MDKGFGLDGFPRTKAQSDVLFSKVAPDLVLDLDVPRSFLIFGIVIGNRRACVDCATGYSDFDPPRVEGICDKCGGELLKRPDDNTETIETRLKLYDEQTMSFLPDIKAKGIVEVLPITESDDDESDEKYLKKRKGEVYRVETDDGSHARMLNLEGMRKRLHTLLAKRYI